MVLNEYGKITHDEILNTIHIRKNIEIDEFVVMPNHVHMILFFYPIPQPIATQPIVETDCICLDNHVDGDACNASLQYGYGYNKKTKNKF